MSGNQKGIAPLALIILAVLGIALGLYLVQTRTNILPHAQQAEIAPQTAFYLSLSNQFTPGRQTKEEENSQKGDQAGQSFNKGWYKPGDQVVVNLAVSSDIDYSNVFNANIQFPQDLLEVVSIQVEDKKGGRNGGSNGGTTTTEPGYYPGSERDSTSSGTTSSTTESVSSEGSDQVCAQVITRACKPKKDKKCKVLNTYPTQLVCDKESDKQCKDFPTPCDVPEGWYVGDPTGSSETSVCPMYKIMCINGTVSTFTGNNKAGCPSYKCLPVPSCRPRPACLDSEPRCLLPETDDMCPPSPEKVRDYFIKFWIEQQQDNAAGTISLIGGMPAQGIKTSPPNRPVMATIIFKAKKVGSAELKFNDVSAIIRVSDNTNILTGKNGLTVDVNQRVPLRGDIDGDGKVWYRDLSILFSKWGTDDKSADLNGDGKVNIYDFSILLSNWNKTGM